MTVKHTETWDAADGILYRQRTEDLTDFLKDLKAEREHLDNGFTKSRNWRKIGSIPMVVVDQMMQQGINPLKTDPATRKAVRRFLNDNPVFRTTERPL